MRRTLAHFSQAVTVSVAVLFVVATLKPDWLRQGHARAVLPNIVSIIEAAPVAEGAGHRRGDELQRRGPAAPRRRWSASPPARRRSATRTPTTPGSASSSATRAGRQQQPQIGLGSGVIVAPEGYLLTNNHVIEGADDIEVHAPTAARRAPRSWAPTPRPTWRVLKIELDKLPVITFGSADNAAGGRRRCWPSATRSAWARRSPRGIVSALGRNQLGINTFENFIQTDAAINPGNSGGALVDVNGNLLGINTAIYSRSGGSLGIGFAIPVDHRQAGDGRTIVKDGQVTPRLDRRGAARPHARDRRDLQPAKASKGVLITGVLQNGPAAQAACAPATWWSSVAGSTSPTRAGRC